MAPYSHATRQIRSNGASRSNKLMYMPYRSLEVAKKELSYAGRGVSIRHSRSAVFSMFEFWFYMICALTVPRPTAV